MSTVVVNNPQASPLQKECNPLALEFVFVSDSETAKGTSGLLGDLKKIGKKIIDTEVFKDLWRTGRTAIDALAGAYGVNTAQFRGMVRDGGYQPDKLGDSLGQAFAAMNVDSASSEDLSRAVDQVLESSNVKQPPQWMVWGAVAFAILSLGGGLAGRSFSRRRRRGRRRR